MEKELKLGVAGRVARVAVHQPGEVVDDTLLGLVAGVEDRLASEKHQAVMAKSAQIGSSVASVSVKAGKGLFGLAKKVATSDRVKGIGSKIAGSELLRDMKAAWNESESIVVDLPDQDDELEEDPILTYGTTDNCNPHVPDYNEEDTLDPRAFESDPMNPDNL